MLASFTNTGVPSLDAELSPTGGRTESGRKKGKKTSGTVQITARVKRKTAGKLRIAGKPRRKRLNVGKVLDELVKHP